MKLPDLPKGNNRREAKLDGPVKDWFAENYAGTILIEVKMRGGKFKQHQNRLIDQISETRSFAYEFPDGQKRTPLDCITSNDIDVASCICTEDRSCVCTVNKDYTLDIKV